MLTAKWELPLLFGIEYAMLVLWLHWKWFRPSVAQHEMR